MYQISILDNGLRVITAEMPHMASVSMGIWMGTGSRYEGPEINGISHFMEHLFFKGTPTRTGKKITEEIEGRGGGMNAFTGEEVTCYYFSVPAKHFRYSYEILCDMISNPLFDQKELDKERGVILEEIKMYLDQPAQHVHDLYNQLLWPDHPLGRTIIGSPESLANINQAELINYKENYYIPQKMVISVAGNVTHQELLEETKKHMIFEKGSKIPKFEEVIETQKKPETLIFEKDTEQTHLCFGVRSFPREHPERYATRLLSVILGENMSSRLFQEIREKHALAYDIHTSITRYYDTGTFTVSAGLEKKKLKKTLAVVLHEMKKLKKDLVLDEELNRAKEYCIGQLNMGLEKTMNNMLWLGENLLCSDQVLTKQEIIDKIQEVSSKQIRKVAQELFVNSKLNMTLIGPIKNKGEIQAELHF